MTRCTLCALAMSASGLPSTITRSGIVLEVRLFLEELPHPTAGDRRTENAPALPKHLHDVLIGTLQRGALGRIAAATGRRRVLGTIDAHQRRRIDLVRGDGDADAVR